MFSSVQIKHECLGVEDVNQSNIPDNSKYPIFMNQDVEYRVYRQFPPFWDHTQLPNDISLKNEMQQNTFHTEGNGSSICSKNYLQHDTLFQVNQHKHESIVQTHPNGVCQPEFGQETLQTQNTSHTEQPKVTNPVLNNVQSTTSIRSSRPGRPPKASSEGNVGKKLKCQCEICFKEFGHKSNLFIHMRTHNGERPYKCNQCEKCFTHSGNLAIHMRTHSGERPYGCQICGKMFSHSGNLSTHLRTHSGVKPYKCSICAKEFRHSGNLSIHERIHSGIKPFQCKVCGKDFYHSGNLTTHMKKHSVNVNQCESNGRRIVNASSDFYSSNTLNCLENVTLAATSGSIKLMQGTNGVTSVKNECVDDPGSNETAMHQ